jgi:hypothetical protein
MKGRSSMSVVRFTRFATLLVFVVSLVASCRPVDTPAAVPSSAAFTDARTFNKNNFCNQGNFSKKSPLICVDPASLLAPSPTPAVVWDLEDDANGNPNPNRPVRIVWQAKTNVALGIKVITKDCLEDVKCAGPICTARVKTLNVPPELRVNPPENKEPYIKRCTYELTLDGQVVDPELEVNPCCW